MSSKPWRRIYADDPSKPAVKNPLKHDYPGKREELIKIIDEVERNMSRPGAAKEVRACGSHWAFSDAALTPDCIVETHDPEPKSTEPCLNQTLYDVIPDCMTDAALEFFRMQGFDPFNPFNDPQHKYFYLYHVEAGTRIYELYCRLDKGDDIEPRSLATKLHGEGYNYDGPWAMQTLGGAGGQTIVGAFSTGTHGGDVHLPPIADAVQAIHLIGTPNENGGREYWIERELAPGITLVDDDKLNHLYPGIKIYRDPDIFNSVIVGVGRFGIIYSVVLRVVRQFALHETREFEDEWANVKTWVGNPFDPKFNNRFVQVLINPNPRQFAPGGSLVTAFGLLKISEEVITAVGICLILAGWLSVGSGGPPRYSCFTTYRDPDPALPLAPAAGIPPAKFAGRAERCGDNAGHSLPFGSDSNDAFSKMCTSDVSLRDHLTSVIQDFEDARNVLLGSLILAVLGVPVGIAAVAAGIAEGLIAALAELRDSIEPGPLFNTVAKIANWAAENGRFDILRIILEFALRKDAKAGTDMKAISYAVMDVHNYLDVNCYTWGDSLEVFFDVSTTAAGATLVSYIDKLLQRINELENGTLPLENGTVTGRPLSFPSYVSLRFMSGSSGLIAMQKWNRVCSVEIAGIGPAHGTEPFLAAAERDAILMGARCIGGSATT
jgi:hypothetical protein